MPEKTAQGTVCLTYDFELAWGCRASSVDRSYGQEYEQTWDTVPKILSILARYEIPGTWATVGAMMLRDDFDFDAMRAHEPTYPWFDGQWYDIPPYSDQEQSRRYYAPQLVEQVLSCRAPQELGCHTFSHIYAGQAQTSAKLMDLELQACREIAAEWGVELRSIVFPRNEIAHLDIVAQNGFKTYRGRNNEWYWFTESVLSNRKSARGFHKLLVYTHCLARLLDEWLMLPPNALPAKRTPEHLVEIAHGAFLPGYQGVSKYVTAKQRSGRMLRGAKKAAQTGNVFCLYFHPHNFNQRQKDCLQAFESTCRGLAELRSAGRIEIKTMAQIAEEAVSDGV